jgi:hypothetical protein
LQTQRSGGVVQKVFNQGNANSAKRSVSSTGIQMSFDKKRYDLSKDGKRIFNEAEVIHAPDGQTFQDNGERYKIKVDD